MASNSSTDRENTQFPPDDSQAEPDSSLAEDNRRLYLRTGPGDARRFAAGLPGGAHVKLLDLSRGGAQFECDRRLNPNSSVSLRLVSQDETLVVSARVVRSRLIKLQSGSLGYLVAVSFNEPLTEAFAPDAGGSSASAVAGAAPTTHVLPTPPDQVSYGDPDLPSGTFADISDADVRAFESALTGSGNAKTKTKTAAVETPAASRGDIPPGRDRR